MARWELPRWDVVIMDYGIFGLLWGGIPVRLFCSENNPCCILCSGHSAQFPQALINFGLCNEFQSDARKVQSLCESLYGRKFQFSGG